MPRIIGFLAIFASVLSGCAGVTHKAYVAPQASFNGGYSDIIAAIEYNARDQGWRVIASDQEAGTVTALTPVAKLGGVQSRERWEFQIDGSDVRVNLYFETRFEDRPSAKWRTATTKRIEASYSYVREQKQLARIGDVLGQTEMAMR